ncbi:MAG TPA: asparagine synthase (glutamine-hydrolyzing) [Thermoanaerobaculaceae bacterium]|nr:asparagine synthase (glutamine-hydrolyzing) [Thermoanaerobaculaceae bacterium]
MEGPAMRLVQSVDWTMLEAVKLTRGYPLPSNSAMCGIVGHALAHSEALPDRRVAQAAITLIKHRGPDDEGLFERPGVFLGHTRLAITGILRGHQPVANETGSVQVVFNGEIYNHHELRRELGARGHRIGGESDSAVLPAAYEEWGLAFVERLDGIFAIAVWDQRQRRLILCRDRFGVKPLYYSHDADGLVFGSELKAVAVARTAEPQIDPAALGDYLAFGYVPGPRTMLRGIVALPPATVLTWQDNGVSSRLYWDPDFSTSATGNEKEAMRRLEAALSTAVGRECVTETPVGAFLSGGLDSSAIVALMSEALRRPFDTFNVGFDEPSFGEQNWAREVSRHFGTRHHEVRCTAADVARLLPEVVWHLDNPAADVSALAEFMVADLAKRDVKVVLSGDGGDEVLAGYPTYKADRVADLVVGAGLRRPAAWSLGLLEPLMPGRSRKLGAAEKIHRLRLGLAAPDGHPHVRWRTVFGERERQRLVTPGVRPCLEDTWARALGWLEGTERWPRLTRFQWLDMRVWLEGCVLRKVDALAMAHAIEVRVPFLDHRVVEAALGSPPSARLRGWTEKYALRRMMEGRLPERIRRRPKAPFQMPLHDWFKGPLDSLAREHFASGGLASLDMVSSAEALDVLDRHVAGRERAGVKLWALLVLSAWMTHCFARIRDLRARPADTPALARAAG